MDTVCTVHSILYLLLQYGIRYNGKVYVLYNVYTAYTHYTLYSVHKYARVVHGGGGGSGRIHAFCAQISKIIPVPDPNPGSDLIWHISVH